MLLPQDDAGGGRGSFNTPTQIGIGSLVDGRDLVRQRAAGFGLLWFALVWFGFTMEGVKTGRSVTQDPCPQHILSISKTFGKEIGFQQYSIENFIFLSVS